MRYLAVTLLLGVVLSTTSATAQTPNERLAACIQKLDRIEAVIHGSGSRQTKINRIHAIYHEASICEEPVIEPPPPPDPTVPGPIQGEGYTQVFADEFATLNRNVWCPKQWWEDPMPANSQFVDAGVLHVVTRRSQGFLNSTVSTEPCGQAQPKSFKQGYMEARMKWTAGSGSSPAFWLFSTRHATNAAWPAINPVCAQLGEPLSHCYSAELDVFEGQGHQPTTYIGTIHRNSSEHYGVNNSMCQGVPTRDIGVNMTTGFHTYAAKWTTTEVRWYLDGTFLGSCPAYDSLDQPMHLLFYQWPDSWTQDPNSTSPDVMETEVDWVRVWQKPAVQANVEIEAISFPIRPAVKSTINRTTDWRCTRQYDWPIRVNTNIPNNAGGSTNGDVQLDTGCNARNVGGQDGRCDLYLNINGNGGNLGSASDGMVLRGATDLDICGVRGQTDLECGAGASHKDGIQQNSAHNVHFWEFQSGSWVNKRSTCHGAGGIFYVSALNSASGLTNVVCHYCVMVGGLPGLPGGVGLHLGLSTSSGARGSCFMGRVGNRGIRIEGNSINPINTNNVSADVDAGGASPACPALGRL